MGLQSMTSEISGVLALGLVAVAVGAFAFKYTSTSCCNDSEHTLKSGEAADDEVEVPEGYTDPITLEVMNDPVVLCATGQVYNYQSLRDWFTMGNRICPKTNLEILDVQVTRLPWLKSQIKEWAEQHGVRLPPDSSMSLETIYNIDPQLGVLVDTIRRGSGKRRTQAVVDLVRAMRKWKVPSSTAYPTEEAQALVRAAVLEDMIWMTRYGEAYLQGVAASLLGCCQQSQELKWLAATAVYPLVGLLQCPFHYAQQASVFVLYNIAVRVRTSWRAIWAAGGVQSLVHIIGMDRDKVKYRRDRAAVVLAKMSYMPEVSEYLQKHAVEPLKKMFMESDDRWEKRDAAFCLLTLGVSESSLGPSITQECLLKYRWCSHKWLVEEVEEPDQGLTEQELEERKRLEGAQGPGAVAAREPRNGEDAHEDGDQDRERDGGGEEDLDRGHEDQDGEAGEGEGRPDEREVEDEEEMYVEAV